MIVAGMFDTEKELDEALTAIYESDVEGDDVTIMRSGDRAGTVSDLRHTVLTGLAVATGKLSDLDLDEEEEEFYRNAIEGEGTVVFIEVDDNQADAIANILKKGNATRVDKID